MVKIITKCSARLTIAVPTGCNTRTFQVKFGGQTSMCLANTSFFLLNASVWSLVWFDNTLLCLCSCHLLGIWGTQGGEPGACLYSSIALRSLCSRASLSSLIIAPNWVSVPSSQTWESQGLGLLPERKVLPTQDWPLAWDACACVALA